MSEVHLAITRNVRPGSEAEFDAAIRRFLRRSLAEPGTTGAYLLSPPPDGSRSQYGILRSFANAAARDAFYASAAFAEWQREVAPWVDEDGDYERRELDGLEAFLPGPSGRQAPPRWKMAVITWLGVFPLVLAWSSVVAPLLDGWPRPAVTAVVTALVVVSLAWGVMPLLARLLHRWLHAN